MCLDCKRKEGLYKNESSSSSSQPENQKIRLAEHRGLPLPLGRSIMRGMKKSAWGNAVLMAFVFLHTQSLEAGTPRLVCDAPIYDFGSVDGAIPITHTFHLRNEGDEDLRIKKVHAPCGCTTYRLDEHLISAGGVLALPVALSLSGRLGQIQKSLYVESSDSATPTLQLILQGVVGQPLEIKPPVMVLRKDQKSGVVFGEVTVRSANRDRLACKHAKSLEGKILLSQKNLPDNDGFVLRAEAVPSLQPGQHRDQILLELENNLVSEKTIDALAIIPAEVIAVPSVLKLDAKTTSPVSRTILVRGPSGSPLSIESVEVPASSITSRIQKISTHTSRIVLENIDPSPDLVGKIVRIQTGGVEPRMLEVSFELHKP